MGQIDVNCPSCGSMIQIPENSTKVFCLLCGKPISISETSSTVIVGITQKVSVASSVDATADLDKGDLSIQLCEYQKALKYYLDATEKEPNSFHAWEGCLRSATKNYSIFDFSIVSMTGLKGLPAIIINTLKLAPVDKLTSIKVDIKRLTKELHTDVLARWKPNNQDAARGPKNNVAQIIGIFGLFLSPIACIFTLAKQSTDLLIASLLLFGLSLILTIVGSSIHTKKMKEFRQTMILKYSTSFSVFELQSRLEKLLTLNLD